MESTQTKKTQMLGCLSVFGSTFFLYLSTLIIRWSGETVEIDPAFFVFARFILGFAVVCVAMGFNGNRPRIKKLHLLTARAFTNCISVFCFYKAVTVTTVAEANILNMTFPLFVTVFAWAFLKEQRDLPSAVTLLVAFLGIFLVLDPGPLGFNVNNIWGLVSGMSGAAAIIYLNVSRKYHDTGTILFFLFGLGSLGIFALFHERMFVPGPRELYYLLLCGGSGVIGQYFLTLGFRYVTAVEGSIISSSRILLAALLGPFLAADPPLAAAGWLGALLIFGAEVYLAVRKARA